MLQSIFFAKNTLRLKGITGMTDAIRERLSFCKVLLIKAKKLKLNNNGSQSK